MENRDPQPAYKPKAVILKTMREINPQTNDKQRFPRKATPLAAGRDLFVMDIEQPTPSFVIVKLGLRFQPPPNYKVVFVPRSSFTKTNWIMQNSPSQGDPDYTGEYQLRFRAIPIGYNLKNAVRNLFSKNKRPEFIYEPFPYKLGERCAQMFLERIIKLRFEEVEDFESTERGNGGFGSTGK
jgi:dUTP pyrophosphatase